MQALKPDPACPLAHVNFDWRNSRCNAIFVRSMNLTPIYYGWRTVPGFLRLALAISAGPMVADAERFVLGELRVEQKAYEDLTHQVVSPLGAKVMNMGNAEWLHAETDHYVVHGTDDRLMHQVAYELEFAHGECDRYFGTCVDTNKGHVFVIDDQELWNALLRSGKSRHVSMALHVESNVFVYRDGVDPFDSIKIPHELIHMRVRQKYGPDCPFWAEEGLAEHLGWVIANRYHRYRYQRSLVLSLPATAADDVLPWSELESLSTYPDDPQAARQVKRQVQRLGKAILARIGDDKIPLFLNTFLGEKMGLREGLTGHLGVSSEEVNQLEAASREVLLSEETE